MRKSHIAEEGCLVGGSGGFGFAMRVLALSAAFLWLGTGCSTTPPTKSESRAIDGAPKLMLYGGKNQKEYLGCLNCDPSDRESITNETGKYGSADSQFSIWNLSGKFGSPSSDYSPWNRSATKPPRIVDEEGNFLGYFTVNKEHPQRTKITELVQLLDGFGDRTVR